MGGVIKKLAGPIMSIASMFTPLGPIMNMVKMATSMAQNTTTAASLEELPIVADEIREAVAERLTAIETELTRVADPENPQ